MMIKDPSFAKFCFVLFWLDSDNGVNLPGSSREIRRVSRRLIRIANLKNFKNI